MKLSILAVSFAALLKSSDALPNQDKQLLRASKEKKQPVQDNAAKGVHFKNRAMEEKANFSVSGLVGSTGTEGGNQRANKKKKHAEKEKKIKALLKSKENEAGAYELKPKQGNDEKVDEAIPTHNQIGLNIVGGDQSSVGDFPYYVDMVGCGGTLIAPDVVLGAAHCGGYIGEEVYVSGYKSGTDSFGATAVKVVSQVRHPNYDADTMENDFYLYRLESEVFPDTQVTLTLNENGADPATGDDLTTLGLGLLSEGGNQPDRLRDVVVQSVSNQECGSNEAYGSEFYPDLMFCASAPGKDSCQGDSGGPIVIRNGNDHVLVGVVSWGYGCAEPDYPGVYARVSSAKSWIEGIVCDTWNSNGSFCGGGNNPTPTPPAPQPNPTPAPQPSPTGPTGEDCVMLKVEFKTDRYPEENSFFAENSQQGRIMEGSNFASRTEYSFEECVDVNSCTTLEFSDSYGDGLYGGSMFNDGYLTVTWDNDVIYDDWEIGFGNTWELGNGCGGQQPNPTPAPVAPTPAPQPTGPTGPAGGDCTTLKVQFQTDSWPEETQVYLEDDENGDVIWDYDNFEADTEYTYTACLPTDACAVLDITDVFGDGLLEDGYMTVTWGADVLYDDWDIGYGFYLYLGDQC